MRGLFAAALLLPHTAFAQDWVTPDICHVETPAISEALFDPPGMNALEAASAEIPHGTGRLWQITSPDGAVSHLWGTMHSSSRHVLNVPGEVLDRLLGSRTLAVEIDYRHPDRDSYRAWIYWDGVWQYDQYRDLGDLVVDGANPEIPAWISARLFERGINPEDTGYLSPGGLAEILIGDPCEDFAAGFPPIQDDYLLTRAFIAGLPIRELEGPHDLRDHLNDPRNEATARALISMYGAYLMPVDDNSERSTAFALYQQGRIGLMMAWDAWFLSSVLGPDADEAMALGNGYLLDERNRIFVEAALPELAEGGVFIAVGAYHLPGEDGMISRLKAAGFTVDRVPLPGEAE